MMKRFPLFLMVFLFVAAPAFAQTGDGGQAGDNTPVRGLVTGSVINGTDGGAVPASGEPMLHILDSASQEQGMEHGELLAGGAFRFEAVPFVPGWQYVAMLNYQNVTYFSEPAPIVAGQTELSIPLTVYEATTATDAVRVTQQHVVFDASAADQVLVGEIYILSNGSDRTVALPAGAAPESAPLAFALPEGAQDITVENNRDGRFKPTDAGFVDTAPLRPGAATSQVVVRYTLPYGGARSYKVNTAWPVEALNLLVPASSGLALQGEGLPPAETMQMGNSAEVAVYNAGPLEPGESLSLQLAGNLVAPAAPAVAETSASTAALPAAKATSPIAPVAILLGTLSLVLAFWFYRRPATEDAGDEYVEPAATFDGLVTEIALLDEAHETGEIDEQDYIRRRSLLFTQAQQLAPEG